MRPLSLSLATLLILASCGGGTTPAATAPTAAATAAATAAPTAAPSRAPAAVLDVPAERSTLRTTAVPPADTDPAITLKLEPHFVAFDTGAAARGQLFVFLTGQAPTPAQGTLIVRQAAANGFHAIGLSFQKINERMLCETNADETCYEKVRLAVIKGGEMPPSLSVAPRHSVDQLLAKLLTHLATRFPAEGWGAYVQAGAAKWDLIRLGGLSQGGSHAALIGRDRSLARLCLFEAPVDLIGAPASPDRRLAPWASQQRATPADRTYGFRNVRSDSANAAAFGMAWAAFGLDKLGAAADTDALKPPYDGSHHLTTKAEPATKDGAANLVHRSVVIDSVTPKTATGSPLFAPVWQYACFS